MVFCPKQLFFCPTFPVLSCSSFLSENFASSCFSYSNCIFCMSAFLLSPWPVSISCILIKKKKTKKVENSHPVSWLLFLLLYLFLFRYLLSFQIHCTGLSFLTFCFCFLDMFASRCPMSFAYSFPLHSLLSVPLPAADLLLQKSFFLLESRVTGQEGGRMLPFLTCSCYSLKLLFFKTCLIIL